ncbi:NADH:ubiquinone reductase (Na(+)-transporting) subunit A, partial [Neisseria sp. P0018.S006]
MGCLNTGRVVVLGGSQVSEPRLLRTVLGAKVSQITVGELVDADNRVISGSVLNGAIARGAHD